MTHASDSGKETMVHHKCGNEVAVALENEMTVSLRARLEQNGEPLAQLFQRRAAGQTRVCWLDELLPDHLHRSCTQNLPPLAGMIRRRSLGERKFVTARLDTFSVPLRELVVGLGSSCTAELVAKIVGSRFLRTDANYYNGGLTVMRQGDFMRPHLDNSHDLSERWQRRVVLLYYLGPTWKREYGGHLQIWDNGGSRPTEIEYVPNRLVILETTESSWHSISRIVGPHRRSNLTTYLYDPTMSTIPVRLTRFRSWPREKVCGPLLDADYYLRTLAHRLGLRRVGMSRHRWDGDRIGASR